MPIHLTWALPVLTPASPLVWHPHGVGKAGVLSLDPTLESRWLWHAWCVTLHIHRHALLDLAGDAGDTGGWVRIPVHVADVPGST